jgi:hypothetical protein
MTRGFCLNRTGIILAMIALEAEFITQSIFTALVVMAIKTIISAEFIKTIMAPVAEKGAPISSV